MANALTINSVETLEQALPTIRASQEKYASFTQEQVDTICEKTAMAVSKMRIPLAKWPAKRLATVSSWIR